MPDVALVAAGTQAAPLAYNIPGAQEIVVVQAAALFDGSSASGDFVPALQTVSPAGNIMGTYVLDSALAAGASANVTWFPRGRVGSSKSSGGDYVFIAEETCAADGDPLAFTTLPTAYRHLEIEWSIDTVDPDNSLSDLNVEWAGTPSSVASNQEAYADGTTGSHVFNSWTSDEPAILIEYCLPSTTQGMDNTGSFGSGRVKLPYWQLSDRTVNARWEWIAPQVETSPITGNGGGATYHDGDQGYAGPIVAPLSLVATSYSTSLTVPFGAGSRATLYGIT